MTVVKSKKNKEYLSIPAWNTSVYRTYTAKGTRHITVQVGDKYLFVFSDKGRSLLWIEDVHMGTWDTYTTKAEKDWWMSLRGSKKLYDETVIPSLRRFLKQ